MEYRPKEGDLYKRITVGGRIFELYYGYYEEFERTHGDPMPIYPDLLADPAYTDSGAPIVTEMQDMCEDGTLRVRDLQDMCCGNCTYFSSSDDLFGVCVKHKKT